MVTPMNAAAEEFLMPRAHRMLRWARSDASPGRFYSPRSPLRSGWIGVFDPDMKARLSFSMASAVHTLIFGAVTEASRLSRRTGCGYRRSSFLPWQYHELHDGTLPSRPVSMLSTRSRSDWRAIPNA